MDTLKICVSGIIACFHKSLKACLHEGAYTAAKHCLLSEKISLSLSLEGGLKKTCSCAAYPETISKCLVPGLSRSILLYRYEAGGSLSGLIFAPYRMTGSLGCYHGNIHILRGNYELVVDIEAMGEHEHISCFKIRLDIGLVHISLLLIRGKYHDDIGSLCRISGIHYR